MNCVTLVGNLASDVELKELAEERKLASFLLAVDRESADGGADFVRVTCWNRQAEICAEYLARGDQVAIDGRLRSRSWQDPDGVLCDSLALEPTEALDQETADALLRSVHARLRGRTLLIVSHRERDLSIVDNVVRVG